MVCRAKGDIMARMFSGNPSITRMNSMERTSEEGATYAGVAWKAAYFVLLTFVAAAAAFIFADKFVESFGALIFIVIAAPIIAFIFAMIASFKPKTAAVTGTGYGVFMGLSVGFISALVASVSEFGGVVFSALIATVTTFGVMTALYATGVIKVTQKFRSFMMAALISVMVASLLIFLVSLFFGGVAELFYGYTVLSVVISVFMVLLAAFMILIDLDNITQLVDNGVDKIYEWRAAFSLLVTLVWLYMEFLKLFMKLAVMLRKK